MLLFLLVGRATIVVGVGVPRVELDDLVVIGNRAIVLTLAVVGVPRLM